MCEISKRPNQRKAEDSHLCISYDHIEKNTDDEATVNGKPEAPYTAGFR